MLRVFFHIWNALKSNALLHNIIVQGMNFVYSHAHFWSNTPILRLSHVTPDKVFLVGDNSRKKLNTHFFPSLVSYYISLAAEIIIMRFAIAINCMYKLWSLLGLQCIIMTFEKLDIPDTKGVPWHPKTPSRSATAHTHAGSCVCAVADLEDACTKYDTLCTHTGSVCVSGEG